MLEQPSTIVLRAMSAPVWSAWMPHRFVCGRKWGKHEEETSRRSRSPGSSQ